MFFPTNEAQKRVWLAHFKEKLPIIGRNLNLDPNRLQQIDQKLGLMISQIDDVHAAEMNVAAVVQTRNENREEYMPEVFQLAKEIKTSSNYLKSMGETLGIEPNPRPKAAKTVPSIESLEVVVKISNQKITFDFKKPRGVSVIIYCRRSDEDFVQVRQITGSTYEDTRSNLRNQPIEKREYCFTLIKNDKESDRSTIYPVAALQ